MSKIFNAVQMEVLTEESYKVRRVSTVPKQGEQKESVKPQTLRLHWLMEARLRDSTRRELTKSCSAPVSRRILHVAVLFSACKIALIIIDLEGKQHDLEQECREYSS